jgi:hypothetical protein
MSVLRILLVTAFTLAAAAQAPPPSPESDTHVFAGSLFDAARHDCGAEVHNEHPSGMCPVSVNTKDFGISQADGKFIKFDEGGNAKAAAALKTSKKGSKIAIDYWRTGKTAAPIKAQVTGSLTSDTLNVNTIRIE